MDGGATFKYFTTCWPPGNSLHKSLRGVKNRKTSSKCLFCGEKSLVDVTSPWRTSRAAVTQITTLCSHGEQKSMSTHTTCWTWRHVGYNTSWSFYNLQLSRFSQIWLLLSEVCKRLQCDSTTPRLHSSHTDEPERGRGVLGMQIIDYMKMSFCV